MELEILGLPKGVAKTRTKRALDDLNRRSATAVRGWQPLRLDWSCPLAEQDHAESFRQFAHVFHTDNRVCVAWEIGRLPDRFLYGLMAHEFGHVMAWGIWQDDSEAGADRAAEDFLGLTIRYGTEYDIQFLTCPEVHDVKQDIGSQGVATNF